MKLRYFFLLFVSLFSLPTHAYKIIDEYDYQSVVNHSRNEITATIQNLNQFQKDQTADERLLAAAKLFIDRPYANVGADGEGDWCPTSSHYQPGCTQLKQDPVYRTDRLDCQTLVQNVLALLRAHSLIEFEKTLLQIKYGALTNSDQVSLFNRNHFISADWLPINQKNGFIQEATNQAAFAPLVQVTTAEITRASFLQKQLENIRVLDNDMLSQIENDPASMTLPIDQKFKSEQVKLQYLPKKALTDDKLLAQIPTPAMVSIVRDTRKWQVAGKNIKDIIGSEIIVSHTGLLYKQSFKKNEVIYQKIQCATINDEKTCAVTPVSCQKEECQEVMFLNASNAYPNHYFWYQDAKGNYHCTKKIPAEVDELTTCNRVMAIPLKDYFIQKQNGSSIMENEAILGINIQKIL